MPEGGGKYDSEATTDRRFLSRLPRALRAMADDIEETTRKWTPS